MSTNRSTVIKVIFHNTYGMSIISIQLSNVIGKMVVLIFNACNIVIAEIRRKPLAHSLNVPKT